MIRIQKPRNTVTLKIKVSHFTCESGIAENGSLGPASYGKTIDKSNQQRRRTLFYGQRGEEAGRDCSEAKAAGEKAELRVMVTCHWLSCRGAHFLREL